jgi:hypothetical protein
MHKRVYAVKSSIEGETERTFSADTCWAQQQGICEAADGSGKGGKLADGLVFEKERTPGNRSVVKTVVRF